MGTGSILGPLQTAAVNGPHARLDRALRALRGSSRARQQTQTEEGGKTRGGHAGLPRKSGTAMHSRSGQMTVSMSFSVFCGYRAAKPARPRRTSTGSGACFGTPLSALRGRLWWNCLTDGSERLGDPDPMRPNSRSAVAPCITRIPGWFCGPAMVADGARPGPDCFPEYRSRKDRVQSWLRWL